MPRAKTMNPTGTSTSIEIPITARRSDRIGIRTKEIERLKAAHKMQVDALNIELTAVQNVLKEKSIINQSLTESLRNISANVRHRVDADSFKIELKREAMEKFHIRVELLAQCAKVKELERDKFQLSYQMQELRTIGEHQNLIKMVDEERERADVQRKRALEQVALALKKEEESDGQPKPWRMCEICSREYEDTKERVPRVLDCGHTICHECITRIHKPTEPFKCPFDRKIIEMDGRNVESFPKNYTILQM
ncbi:RING-type domain-containing protein [Caenorhabditis elegans]|uniref:RING-type domain-containing protein n=1 Tax=Caenorhabditis elegans TaxID=6239 RepID=Q9U1S9_CAEEL|nr:RING-type domain-containing protein [Caenorhabditis elegans]CAB60579.2 RING-type domain-containing protein [Caenorhabditis elegans]|eukprot:NP_496525.2 Uncharacterized protein CELE_Y6D1A.2 [Caenorhabditis elegans]